MSTVIDWKNLDWRERYAVRGKGGVQIIVRDNHTGAFLLAMMERRRKKLIEEHGEGMGNYINSKFT